MSSECRNREWRGDLGLSGRNSGVEKFARLTLTLLANPRSVLILALLGLAGLQCSDPRLGNNNTSFKEIPVSTPVESSCGILIIDNTVSFPQRIKDYITYYLTCDIGGLFTGGRKLEVVTTQNPISMQVIAEDGIILRDFPDIRPSRSRKIPTNGSATGPTIKAWYWGHEIPGEYQNFVVEYDPETRQLINIWAVRLSDEGGWSFYPQSHFEFFRVGTFVPEKGVEWFVSFKVDGKTVSGENLPATIYGDYLAGQ